MLVGRGVSVGNGVFVTVGVGVKVGVAVLVGVLVTVGVAVLVGVLVAVGALAVNVAKTFCVICASVAFASGVGGTGVGVALGAQPTIAKRKINAVKNTSVFLIMPSPLKKE